MNTRKLVRLIFSSSKLTVGIENVTLSRIALRYYLDSVPVILTAPSLQMYVMLRAVTGTDCHAEPPASRVQCFKVTKIDPVSPFCSTLWLKKATLQWDNSQEVRKASLWAVNIYFCAFRNWKCLHHRRPRRSMCH